MLKLFFTTVILFPIITYGADVILTDTVVYYYKYNVFKDEDTSLKYTKIISQEKAPFYKQGEFEPDSSDNSVIRLNLLTQKRNVLVYNKKQCIDTLINAFNSIYHVFNDVVFSDRLKDLGIELKNEYLYILIEDKKMPYSGKNTDTLASHHLSLFVVKDDDLSAPINYTMYNFVTKETYSVKQQGRFQLKACVIKKIEKNVNEVTKVSIHANNSIASVVLIEKLNPYYVSAKCLETGECSSLESKLLNIILDFDNARWISLKR